MRNEVVLIDARPTRHHSPVTGALQIASGTRYFGKLKGEQGTLVLLPDRLAFVRSKARAGALAFGAIGMLVVQGTAKKRAPARAAEGRDDVTAVPLAELQAIERSQQGLNKNVLVISGPGTDLKVGVRYDEWAPAITAAAHSLGRQSTIAADRVDFS